MRKFKRYEEKRDWWIYIKRSFMNCTEHEIYSVDEIKRDESHGAGGRYGTVERL